MDQFLSSVERRAYRIAKIAVGSHDDALDLVQDAMLGLVRHYRHHREDEWGEIETVFNKMLQSLEDNVSALRESEKRYREIFLNATEGIFRATV